MNKGTTLHDYIKAEQDRAREDRQKEQLDLEHKHKLELIAKGGDMQVIACDNIKVPNLPPFEEKSDDINSYLKRFKRHAEAHNWHKTIWATHPSALLKGSSLDVHVLLQFEHVIKTALAKAYIDSPYFVGEVIVWCLQNPLYDVIIGNVEGAIDPYDPELNHEVGVVSRLQIKKMAHPYSKLKVPNSISHVSVDEMKSAQ